MTDTTVELSFKKASTPSSTRFLAEYVCGDYSVTKEEGTFNGITWVARHKGQERANFPRLLDGKRWCSEHSEKRTQAAAAQAIEDAKTEQAEWDRHVTEALPADSPERTPATPQQLKSAGVAVDPGKVTGLHYRGKSLGLKHYRAMGLAEGRTAPKRKRAAVSLPNSQRIQNYARQNGTVGAVTDSSPVATLTPKQMRRVRKHILANLATDPIDIRCMKTYPKRAGEALLALAPNGYGIFHQFSN